MNQNIKIESIGVYLPPKTLTTQELLKRCKNPPRWDFEKVVGIRERRVAEGEYAADLAIQAARRALRMSRYSAEDIDLLICTSISKYNRPPEVDFEPAAAATIRRALGARNALCFDVVNACAGMFNGMHIAQSYLASGAARCALVVSGEHNWPLTDTATRQIRHSFDGQLASLTLGDAGAALILEPGNGDGYGLQYLELVTGAKHNHFCYSTPSKRGPGGVLMTKARGLQLKGAEHFPFYLKKAVDRSGWAMSEIDYGIAHQVSVRGVKNGIKVVNRFLNAEVPHPYIYNCQLYGNTTTTSHFVVLHEFLRDATVQRDHKLLFVSGASGIVITHATYRMDDLGERLRASLAEHDDTPAAGATTAPAAEPLLPPDFTPVVEPIVEPVVEEAADA